MKKRYSLTLLEIMIVIFLIGLIGSVIGYNMKGSLDEGRAFKTEQAAAQIRDILAMEIAKGASMEDVIKNADKFLENSGLVKHPEKLLKDGWGEPFKISRKGDSEVNVTSVRYTRFKNAKKTKLGIDVHTEEDELQTEED